MKSYKHNALKTMNIEDIKVGETYYIRVKPVGVCNEEGYINVRDMEGDIACFKAKDVYPVDATKYDPCREFKEGDVVRYKPCNGRDCKSFPDDEFFRERTLTVIASEDSTSHNVMVISQDGRTRVVEFCYLELITPVEELEPYSVGGSIDGCILYKNGEHYAEFVNSIDAERACKLLNAEYRKEQSNEPS